ncbi:SOS response-associated peptidase [Corynebacterium sp. P5848]|uniref:SOS response-associated peptidase n=1 Tax=Corynebacterium marambiense TaxID=2765364 RepID=UPI002260E2DE|nr:SOS response-associated peptidase [Corynebacterium marambiense]MCX7541381.1 SOS response-associated peptidase [Corynebacterium marambiense]
MCGRFVLFTTSEALTGAATALPGVRSVAAPLGTPPPRYNIAPTQIVPILRPAGRVPEAIDVEISPARWGLLPHWKKDDGGPVLFNARAESAPDKPSFRDAFDHRRCAIPLNGWYEWREKRPYYVHPADGDPVMWVAGLWDTGLDTVSATIITTTPVGEQLTRLHDRMPRILAPEEVAMWIGGAAEQARDLLRPARPEMVSMLSLREVDRAVGNARNEGQNC